MPSDFPCAPPLVRLRIFFKFRTPAASIRFLWTAILNSVSALQLSALNLRLPAAESSKALFILKPLQPPPRLSPPQLWESELQLREPTPNYQLSGMYILGADLRLAVLPQPPRDMSEPHSF